MHDFRHIMIPIEPLSPDARRWSAKTAELVASFAEAMGDAPDSLCSFAVHTAADVVWMGSKGEPTWEAFDPDAYFEASSLTPGEDMHAMTLMTLMAFIDWLQKNGHISSTIAISILRRLGRHVTPHSMLLYHSFHKEGGASTAWN